MSSIFTRIIKGEIPSFIIGETEHCFAFLDINPLKTGHTLIVTKKEVDRLFELEDEMYCDMFDFSKKVARAIRQAFPCNRIGMAVIGLEVPHAHIHLVPIDAMSDIDFTRPKLSFSNSEFEQIAAAIRSHLT